MSLNKKSSDEMAADCIKFQLNANLLNKSNKVLLFLKKKSKILFSSEAFGNAQQFAQLFNRDRIHNGGM